MKSLKSLFTLFVLICSINLVYADEPNWSGSYAGIAGGLLSSQSNWTTKSNFVSGTNQPSLQQAIDYTSPYKFSSSSGQVTGFGGHNWQFDSYVLGIEGDFAWTNNNSSIGYAPGVVACTNCYPSTSTSGDSSSVKLGWNASLRPRFGYLLTPDTLLYGTAGVATQSMKVSQTCQASYPDPICYVLTGTPSAYSSNNYTALGYALGAGLEKMYGDWIIRAEYRYNQYQNINVNSNLTASGGGTTSTTILNSNVRVSTQFLNVGIAYKF